MRTVICTKCNEVIAVPDHQDFVICCNEVIYAPYEKDVDIFFNELSNPSKPNEALKKAATRYKKRTDETHNCENETPDGVCRK
jgi:uncharacterized protein (DUF1778 family)